MGGRSNEEGKERAERKELSQCGEQETRIEKEEDEGRKKKRRMMQKDREKGRKRERDQRGGEGGHVTKLSTVTGEPKIINLPHKMRYWGRTPLL